MQSEYSLESLNFAAFTKPNKHKTDSKDFSTTWPNLFSNTFTTGRELERALVDVTGTGKTAPSCREKRFEIKLCKRRLNSLTVVEVFENKFGRVVEKNLSSPFCVCLVS